MKTNLKLSRELKHKIKTDMRVSMKTPMQTIEYAGHQVALPTQTIINGELNFSIDEKYLYEECCNWCYNYHYKINIGRFFGVRPLTLSDNIVRFYIDYFERESWKDWFVDENLQ
jgi:hypothetical protein